MRSLHFVALGLVLALSFARGTAASAAPPTILIDGHETSTDVPAIGDGVHMLVPLHVLEQLGATVSFDAASGSADIKWRGVDAKINAGSLIATVDGARMVMDVAPRVFAGRMEVPLHLLNEAFNVNADYDAGTNTVAIVTGQSHGNFVATLSGPAKGSYSRANATGSVPTLPGSDSSVPSAPSSYSSPPTISDVQPAPQSVVGSTYPQIYARLGGGDSSIDPSTVRLEVDGGDVTNLATISSAYVAYTPSAGLANGSHSVTVSGEALDGTPIYQTWTFTVDAGNSYDYASSVIGYYPQSYGYGYRRYGFCPPGFSLYSPGPLWLYGGNVVEVIFFSRFFPYGNGFITIGGFPGSYPLQPWYGYPGYYFGMVPVPFGIHPRLSVLAAKFKTDDGRTVVVHSTAPLHVDGTRRSAPIDLRYAVMPSIVNRPLSPRVAVAFHTLPIERRAPIEVRIPRVTGLPVGRHYDPILSRPIPTNPKQGRVMYPGGSVFVRPIAMPLPTMPLPTMPIPTMPMPRPVMPHPIPHPMPPPIPHKPQ
ncbi:MAG TPA: stalk domain-containing protein [Candidatus Eremiobacteraceae bacterium]|nr:stalk domain-containing protein [Candidatus Eremiobacteraceae bacterium]